MYLMSQTLFANYSIGNYCEILLQGNEKNAGESEKILHLKTRLFERLITNRKIESLVGKIEKYEFVEDRIDNISEQHLGNIILAQTIIGRNIIFPNVITKKESILIEGEKEIRQFLEVAERLSKQIHTSSSNKNKFIKIQKKILNYFLKGNMTLAAILFGSGMIDYLFDLSQFGSQRFAISTAFFIQSLLSFKILTPKAERKFQGLSTMSSNILDLLDKKNPDSYYSSFQIGQVDNLYESMYYKKNLNDIEKLELDEYRQLDFYFYHNDHFYKNRKTVSFFGNREEAIKEIFNKTGTIIDNIIVGLVNNFFYTDEGTPVLIIDYFSMRVKIDGKSPKKEEKKKSKVNPLFGTGLAGQH